MVVVAMGRAECLECGAVCVGACTLVWLQEHWRHGEREVHAPA